MRSVSRPRRPSGEPCIDESFVVSCAVSGDMMGDVCRELDVVTEEVLMADAGVVGMCGGKLVWTLLGFGCLIVTGCVGWDVILVVVVVVCVLSKVFGSKEGLEVLPPGKGMMPYGGNGELPNSASLHNCDDWRVFKTRTNNKSP